MEDVPDRFRAGEPLASVARDFHLDRQDVEDAIRRRPVELQALARTAFARSASRTRT
jgi:uncharacterized protein (DUF433 family)